jgi:hypothetical protein
MAFGKNSSESSAVALMLMTTVLPPTSKQRNARLLAVLRILARLRSECHVCQVYLSPGRASDVNLDRL